METLDKNDDLYPDVGVLDTPPKIITWSGQALGKAWHQFYITDISKSQHPEYGYAVVAFLNWAWAQGVRDIIEITAEILEDHIATLEDATFHQSQIMVHLCALNRFFTFLCAQNILVTSPCPPRGLHI